MDWQQDAACLGLGHDLFFGLDARLPIGKAEERAAKLICHACPVRLDCLAYAMSSDERWGVWGGTTASERERLRKRIR